MNEKVCEITEKYKDRFCEENLIAHMAGDVELDDLEVHYCVIGAALNEMGKDVDRIQSRYGCDPMSFDDGLLGEVVDFFGFESYADVEELYCINDGVQLGRIPEATTPYERLRHVYCGD